jgi:hypothetical protein
MHEPGSEDRQRDQKTGVCCEGDWRKVIFNKRRPAPEEDDQHNSRT